MEQLKCIWRHTRSQIKNIKKKSATFAFDPSDSTDSVHPYPFHVIHLENEKKKVDNPVG